MLARRNDTAHEETEETYQPPALVVLGSVEELTAFQPYEVTSLTPSDRALKQEIAPFRNALGRLRAVGLR